MTTPSERIKDDRRFLELVRVLSHPMSDVMKNTIEMEMAELKKKAARRRKQCVNERGCE